MLDNHCIAEDMKGEVASSRLYILIQVQNWESVIGPIGEAYQTKTDTFGRHL